MAEPVTPAGWVAILAAILLPFTVAIAWTWTVQGQAEAALQHEIDKLRIEVLQHEVELAHLRRHTAELDADLDALIDVD